MKKQELVFPGSFLSTEEEFMAGSNAFEDEKGSVLADSVGSPEFDFKEREAKVLKRTPVVRKLDEGSVVIARIFSVKDKAALVEMLEAKKDSEPRKIIDSFASIPVFDSDERFVEDIHDLFKIGDLVKARVSVVKPYGIDLSTKERGFGVIKAFCVKCRYPLKLSGRELKCIECGNLERRKLSTDYIYQCDAKE